MKIKDWEFSIGTYTGVLIGFRSYQERSKSNHVFYIPFEIFVLRFGMGKNLNKKILSDLTVYMKYAKYLPELNRRETWEELVRETKRCIRKGIQNYTTQLKRIIDSSIRRKFYRQ